MYRIIFKHYPKVDQEKEFIAAWQKGSDIIQTCEGALGTKLFRDKDNPKILYASAEWESKETRDKAMEKLEKRPDSHLFWDHEKFVEKVETLASMDLIAEANPQK